MKISWIKTMVAPLFVLFILCMSQGEVYGNSYVCPCPMCDTTVQGLTLPPNPADPDGCCGCYYNCMNPCMESMVRVCKHPPFKFKSKEECLQTMGFGLCAHQCYRDGNKGDNMAWVQCAMGGEPNFDPRRDCRSGPLTQYNIPPAK